MHTALILTKAPFFRTFLSHSPLYKAGTSTNIFTDSALQLPNLG